MMEVDRVHNILSYPIDLRITSRVVLFCGRAFSADTSMALPPWSQISELMICKSRSRACHFNLMFSGEKNVKVFCLREAIILTIKPNIVEIVFATLFS